VNQDIEMAKADNDRLKGAGSLALILAMFAVLLTAGYHIVSLFVQLMANEYAAHVWNSHF